MKEICGSTHATTEDGKPQIKCANGACVCDKTGQHCSKFTKRSEAVKEK